MNFFRSSPWIAYLVFPFFRFLVFFGFILSKLIKRNKKIWVFGSYSESFTDNSKYLFIYLTENYRGITPVWISGDCHVVMKIRQSGGNAYYRWSMLGIYYSLRGGIWFYTSYPTNINFLFWYGAELVNLWHGIPFKKIEFDIDNGKLFNVLKHPTFIERYMLYANLFIKPNWLISTSEYVSSYSFRSAFKMSPDKVIALGSPRLDPLFWDHKDSISFLARWQNNEELELLSDLTNFKKVILYMPTWRDNDSDFLSKTFLNLSKLNTVLKKNNHALIIKLHVNTPKILIGKMEDFSNIKILPNRFDIYSLLKFSDALITDYSSIYFDYLLLNKPILLFCFDLDRYLNNSRSAYFDYKIISGSKIKTFENLLKHIDSLDDSYLSTYKKNRLKTTLNKFFDDTKGNYSHKITNFFLAQLRDE